MSEAESNKNVEDFLASFDAEPFLIRINCILWADGIILHSESEEGLNELLGNMKDYSDLNHLKVNTDKT